MNVTYYEIYHNSKNSEYIISKRLEMVKYAIEFGVKPTARQFKTSKNTVKRWLKRYQAHGIDGLKNHSTRPLHFNNPILKKDIDKIQECVIDAKEKKKYITVNNVRKKTKIFKYSDATINRYINKSLDKKKRNISKPKSNGGDISFKEKLNPFSLIQIDIKYLTDIDSLKPYFKNRNLARYEITARDVATGFSIVSYCEEKSLYYTHQFLENILYPFLKSIPGIDLKKILIQTDNGREFTNKNNRRILEVKESIFTNFCKKYFKGHKTNIPGHCTADSEVESFHWSIERDCLAWEDINNNETLVYHVSKYMQEYNSSIIKKRGYSPLEKILSFFNISSLNLPTVKIL